MQMVRKLKNLNTFQLLFFLICRKEKKKKCVQSRCTVFEMHQLPCCAYLK